MTVSHDVQKLEPGSLVELFELDATEIGGEWLRFHNNDNTGIIYWQGNEYDPWPLECEGFARTSSQPPMPKMRVGNLEGSISNLCATFGDMLGSRVIRRRTFARYLDATNFPGGNPSANPDQEFTPEIWYVERKAFEDHFMVEFELASAMELNGVMLPRRQIIANMCPSSYRSADCGYTGPPVATLLDAPTSDLTLDRCSKRLGSCKLRVWPNDVLGFGGFPAAGLMRS